MMDWLCLQKNIYYNAGIAAAMVVQIVLTITKWFPNQNEQYCWRKEKIN